MAIIGNVLSGNRSGVKEQTLTLQYRLSNTSKAISNYQKSIKSSDLRSSSASLSGIVSNTDRDLSSYIDETYKKQNAKLSEKTEKNEDDHYAALDAELFEAKINGILDRIYAHKMDYEISLLLAMEKKLYDAASNDDLKNILNTSYDSLANLQNKFANFSEAN